MEYIFEKMKTAAKSLGWSVNEMQAENGDEFISVSKASCEFKNLPELEICIKNPSAESFLDAFSRNNYEIYLDRWSFDVFTQYINMQNPSGSVQLVKDMRQCMSEFMYAMLDLGSELSRVWRTCSYVRAA